MSQANPTITAVIQLATLLAAMSAVVVCAVFKVLPEATTAALLGGIIAHSGIVAYNGATKGSPSS